MNYEVNANNPNVSITQDSQEQVKDEWSVENLYKSELTVDGLIKILYVIDALKRKYYNDDIIKAFEDIIRDEICQMFGGSITNEI